MLRSFTRYPRDRADTTAFSHSSPTPSMAATVRVQVAAPTRRRSNGGYPTHGRRDTPTCAGLKYPDQVSAETPTEGRWTTHLMAVTKGLRGAIQTRRRGITGKKEKGQGATYRPGAASSRSVATAAWYDKALRPGGG